MPRARTSDEVKRLSGTYRPHRSEMRRAMRAAWATPDGKRELREWARYFPGTRPVSWWWAVAPERRRRSESQAAYLKRLDLLLPGEAKRLAKLK